MDVAPNAYHEIGVAQGGNRLGKGWRSEIGRSGKCAGALKEFSSVHVSF
jgi:hypothetical protein